MGRMEQTLPLRKTAKTAARAALISAAILAAPGCASDAKLAEAPMAAPVSPARAASLRSLGYDAPDVAAPARALVVPARYEAASAPAAPQAPSAPEAMSPYFTPEAASEATSDTTPAVPAPRPSAYAAAPRAPLPDLDAIVVTEDTVAAEKAPEAPVRTAQVFEGETRSVMPRRTAPEAKTPAAEPAPATAPIRREPANGTARSGGSALHLASYRQASQAEAGWQVLTRDHGAVLAGLSPALARVDVPGQGAFVRLIAGPLAPTQARTACAALETQGAYCAVTDWSPEAF